MWNIYLFIPNCSLNLQSYFVTVDEGSKEPCETCCTYTELLHVFPYWLMVLWRYVLRIYIYRHNIVKCCVWSESLLLYQSLKKTEKQHCSYNASQLLQLNALSGKRIIMYRITVKFDWRNQKRSIEGYSKIKVRKTWQVWDRLEESDNDIFSTMKRRRYMCAIYINCDHGKRKKETWPSSMTSASTQPVYNHTRETDNHLSSIVH